MHELYALKDKLCAELKEFSHADLSTTSLEEVDTLTHTLKNLNRIIEDYEEEEYSSRGGRSMGYGMNDGSYARRNDRSYRGSYGGSMRRDSRGRYSRGGDMFEELRELMQEAPDDQTRQEFEKFIRKMEQM